jgi:poly(A) polymerase Pap1
MMTTPTILAASSPTTQSKVISDKPPNELDRRQTQQILQYLQQQNVFPSQEEEERRIQALHSLELILAEWIREVSLEVVCILYHHHQVMVND